MTRYQFEELKAKALRSDATQEDINRLGEWFQEWGQVYWNGEYFDVGGGVTLWPFYKEYYAVECRYPGLDGWQLVCVTDKPTEEIERQCKTIENLGDVEFRAKFDHEDISRYCICL